MAQLSLPVDLSSNSTCDRYVVEETNSSLEIR